MAKTEDTSIIINHVHRENGFDASQAAIDRLVLTPDEWSAMMGTQRAIILSLTENVQLHRDGISAGRSALVYKFITRQR